MMKPLYLIPAIGAAVVLAAAFAAIPARADVAAKPAGPAVIQYHQSSEMLASHARKYYWFKGQEYFQDADTGDRVIVTTPPIDYSMTPKREYHRSNLDRKYYSFDGHHYYMNMVTGERMMMD
jgi:hypothetical protein